MSQHLLELPPSVYQALLRAALQSGTTPTDWIAARLPENQPAYQEVAAEDQLDRIEGFAYYLGSIVQSKEISSQTAALVLKAWNELHKADRRLPVPDAAPGPEQQLLCTWNKGEHHLELEVFPEGPAEFFYFNRATDAAWEEEYTIGAAISDAVRQRLSLIY